MGQFGNKADRTGVGFHDPAPLVSENLRSLHPTATRRERRALMGEVIGKHRGLPPVLRGQVVTELVDAMGLAEYHRRGGAVGNLAINHA